jgi:hypothetical protein
LLSIVLILVINWSKVNVSVSDIFNLLTISNNSTFITLVSNSISLNCSIILTC